MSWLVERAYAYTVGIPVNGNKTEYANFSEYFIDLVGLAINLGGALAVIMILFGAFKYVTSAGDDSKAKEGKDVIVGAVVGLALLLLIKLIVPIIGIDTN